MTKKIVTKAIGFLLWFLLGSSLLLLSFLSSPNPFLLIQNKQQQLIIKLGLDDKTDETNLLGSDTSYKRSDIVSETDIQTGVQHNYRVFENSTDGPTSSSCDLFDGRWVRDDYGNGSSGYSNYTCRTLPESKNCGKYGKEQDFVNWRWKPDGCDLARFDGKKFLNMVRGKRMAFVGDSVARNQMESLLCLLSQVETPVSIQKDSEDRFRTWYFRSHDFILTVMWTKFLVAATEQTVNGTATGVYDLHLDRIDTSWTEKLPWINYMILSGGHWFSRKLYLHENDRVIGCVYCSGENNLTDFGPASAVQRAFRTALGHINGCADCDGLLTLVRTFAPAHFENGVWNQGGRCNRTAPLGEREVSVGGTDWGMRNAQLEEVQSARKDQGKGAVGVGRRFEILDVTKAMMARADAHPGEHWNNEWMKGYSDCVHWCLPGPIDVWNDMLLEILSRHRSDVGLQQEGLNTSAD